MIKNSLKRPLCFLASLITVLAYFAGGSVLPAHAEDEWLGLEELLEKRNNYVNENGDNGEVSVEIPPQVTPNVPQAESMISFSDVNSGDWFYEHIKYLTEAGLISGKTENSFEPNGHFSHAECSAVIVRYLGLESEAQKRQQEIIKRLPQLQNVWYAGYFEVLCSLGLFTEYGLFTSENGLITSVDTALSDSPILRYRFAESISKSFEIESETKSKNLYSELSGSGRDFIMGGSYDKDILYSYIHHISDFDDIPAESQIGVLKAYYNGIFTGDDLGRFLPHSPLTRAEMSKVLSAICNYSFRKRLICDGYADMVTEDMLHTDAVGVTTLDFDVWTSHLYGFSECISYSGDTLTFTPSVTSPEGYATDVYLYEKTGDTYTLCREWTLKSRKEDGFTYKGSDFKILLVLRNVKCGARVEGVYAMKIESGKVVAKGANIW